jgi:phage protein D
MPDPTQTGLRAARPNIRISGEDRPALSQGLLSMIITETTEGMYCCEALFGNWGNTGGTIGFLYFDRQVLDFGVSFDVSIGGDTIFDGKIMALEANFPEGAPPELNVLAEDRLQDLRMTRRTRSFEDVSDAQVIQRLAGEHGLQTQIDINGPTHSVLAQVNQSDLAFMRDRARACNAELWVDGDALNAAPRTARNGQPMQMTHRGTLREFSVLADLAGQHTDLMVSGWEVAGKSHLRYEASDTAIQEELNGDLSGAAILQSSLGDRKQAYVHMVPHSQQEAQTQAESLFKSIARRFVVGRGVAETDSRLRVGAYVDLQGLGPLFSGKYYLSEVKHLFDGTLGIRTEFVAERPGLGRPA